MLSFFHGQQFAENVGKAKRVNHGAVQKYRTRKLVAPLRVLAIDGDLIPINAMLVTAAWPGMLPVGFQAACQLFRK